MSRMDWREESGFYPIEAFDEVFTSNPAATLFFILMRVDMP